MTSNNIYTSEKALPYVYRLDNPTTGEFYIGYRVANKIPSHLDFPIYKTSAPKVTNIFDLFEWKILAEFYDGDDAYDFEQLSIFEEWDNPLLLNESCYHNKGKFKNTSPHSQKTKDKISGANKGKAAAKDPNTGKSLGRIKLDDIRWKTGEIISVAKGQIQTADANKKRSNKMKGIPQSAESNIKRSIAKMGIPRPPFFSIIDTRKTYDKSNLSKWKPEFRQYY